MTRGKHGKAAANRRILILQEQIERLETEKAELASRLVAAERHARTFDSVVAELATTKSDLAAGTSDRIVALEDRTRSLSKDLKAEQAETKRANKVYRRLFERFLRHLVEVDGTDRMEAIEMLAQMGGNTDAILVDDDYDTSRDTPLHRLFNEARRRKQYG